jgi:putative transposase
MAEKWKFFRRKGSTEMKKSRFTDSQIVDVLKRAESRVPVPDLCRELGISTATFYK